jgi:hypothetical protein
VDWQQVDGSGDTVGILVAFLLRPDDEFTKTCRFCFQAMVRKIGSHPTPDQQRDITVKWAHLQERVDAFQKQVANIFQAASDS